MFTFAINLFNFNVNKFKKMNLIKKKTKIILPSTEIKSPLEEISKITSIYLKKNISFKFSAEKALISGIITPILNISKIDPTTIRKIRKKTELILKSLIKIFTIVLNIENKLRENFIHV